LELEGGAVMHEIDEIYEGVVGASVKLEIDTLPIVEMVILILVSHLRGNN
jgi:hypothetical protein